MAKAISSKVLDLAKRVISKYSGKDKKGVPQSAIKKFAGKHGREAAVKGFGKPRVERVMKVMDTKAEAAKKSRLPKAEGEIKTPTSFKKAPKKMKKKAKAALNSDKDKSKASNTLRKAMKSRDQEGRKSFTTTVGKGVSTKPKLSRTKKKEAQRKSEQREAYEDFESRLSGMAHQGGVSGTGKGPDKRTGTAFDSGEPVHGLTGEGQASDFMRGADRDVRIDPDDFFDKRMHGGQIGSKKKSIQQRGWGKARKR